MAQQLWPSADAPYVARIKEAADRFLSAIRDGNHSEIWFDLMTTNGRVATSAYAADRLIQSGRQVDLPVGGTFASWVSVLLDLDVGDARTDFFNGLKEGLERTGILDPNCPSEVFPCRGGYMVLYQVPHRPGMFPILITPQPEYRLDMETYLVASSQVTVERLLGRGLQLLSERRFAEAVSVLEGAVALAPAHRTLQEPVWQRLFNDDRKKHLAGDSQLLVMATARLAHAQQLLSLTLQAPIPDDLLTVRSIFLSHSSHDNEFCQRLASSLRELGLRVWYDEWEIKVGDSIVDKVNEGLKGNDYLCVVLSNASVKSEWVRKEINAGFVQGIREKRAVLLPIRIDDCEIPPLLQDLKAADFRNDYFLGLSQLVDRLIAG